MIPKKGRCHLTYIPMRAEASGKSEMVSQLIYGEDYEVKSEENGWYFIKNNFDGYEGWISKAQYNEGDSEYIVTHHVRSLFGIVPQEIGAICIPASSPIDVINVPADGELISLEETKAVKEKQFLMVQDAQKFLHTPYLWGGRTFMGIDCSGLIQAVARMAGINLPRDAKDQAKVGTSVVSLSESRAGDVVFFNNEKGNITHVGLLLSPKEIIHSHGSVRIDKIDDKGIFNSDRNEYSHHFHSIKRLV
jgi:hypothetical protein